jgi:hypothetical protein
MNPKLDPNSEIRKRFPREYYRRRKKLERQVVGGWMPNCVGEDAMSFAYMNVMQYGHR